MIAETIATGYGRRLVPGVGRTFTEITCHARGVAAMCPGTRLVIDIGGQDSKAILVDELGIVEDFAMNDRCASGTGRFFEVLARAIECDIGELADLALSGNRDLEVSSMCATFAETEIISLLARGERREDIAASVHRAVAARTLGLVAQVGRHTPVVMTGGVARNAASVHFVAQALDVPVSVPDTPQITGAFGAALLARESFRGHQIEADGQAGTPGRHHHRTVPPATRRTPGWIRGRTAAPSSPSVRAERITRRDSCMTNWGQHAHLGLTRRPGRLMAHRGRCSSPHRSRGSSPDRSSALTAESRSRERERNGENDAGD